MDGKITGTGLRSLTGYLLRRTSQRMQANAVTVLAPLNLRIPSFSVLAVIAAEPGLTLSQIAAQLNMERSNAVPVVDGLLQAGLIERKQLESDRRAYALFPTPEGQRCSQAAEAALRESERTLLAPLDGEEQRQLHTLLARLAL